LGAGFSTLEKDDSDSDTSLQDEKQGSDKKKDQDVMLLSEWIDEMWKVKTEQADQCSDLTLSTFCMHFALPNRECFKGLSVFQRCSSKEGRLLPGRLLKMLQWPPDQNRVVSRIITCFDGDGDAQMDFREFLMFAAMHKSDVSNVDKMRFWWWIMLFSDAESVSSADTCRISVNRVPREQAIKLAAGERLLITEKKKKMDAGDGEDVNTYDLSNFCVPLETVCRFLRDFLASATGLPLVHSLEVAISACVCVPCGS
jgi:hypothetical protein